MSLAKSFKMLLAGLVLACGVQGTSQAAGRMVVRSYVTPAFSPRIIVTPWLNPQPEPPIPVYVRPALRPVEIRTLSPQPAPSVLWLIR